MDIVVAAQEAGKVSVPQWLILTLTFHIGIQLVRPVSDRVHSRRSICQCAVQLNSSWECRQGVALLYRGGRRREGPQGSPVRCGLWPTTQYITADENESSGCVTHKLSRCACQMDLAPHELASQDSFQNTASCRVCHGQHREEAQHA